MVSSPLLQSHTLQSSFSDDHSASRMPFSKVKIQLLRRQDIYNEKKHPSGSTDFHSRRRFSFSTKIFIPLPVRRTFSHTLALSVHPLIEKGYRSSQLLHLS